MQQAIEESFILDVLQNYTPYKLAFRLAHNGKDYDDAEVNRTTAMKGLMQWVRLHPHKPESDDHRRAFSRQRHGAHGRASQSDGCHRLA